MTQGTAVTPSSPYIVAAVEFNPELFERDRNIERACAVAEEAAENGAKLIVFPECALSGYIYRDLEQFLPFMDSVPGKGTSALEQITKKHHCYVAIGVAEHDPESGLTYNTGALIGPEGYIGKYRKNGLNPSDILWFTPGNTGYPVFDTELGRLSMVICYDDTYWEPARVPAVHGADLIAYICASDRVFTELGPEAKDNHSTIAAVQQLTAFNGLAMVAADRNNVESNPTTGISVVYGGSASIWQADGQRTGHLPATHENVTAANPGQILYGHIDPALFRNSQKETLTRRRPELYRDLAFYKVPTDGQASSESHDVILSALQYEIHPGDRDGNISRAHDLLTQLQPGAGLIVLPALSFIGLPADSDQAESFSENQLGHTVQVLSDFASQSHKHLVGSFIERDGEDLFHTAALVGPDGTLIGTYRQTHLDPTYSWASPGDALKVFTTEIGRIALMLNDDARFPEVAGVYAVRRADLIALPSNWNGQWGGWLQDSEGLFAHGYPSNTMNFWYSIAKLSQCYTVVANAVGDGAQGSSGVFTLNPVDREAPQVASVDASTTVSLAVTTTGDPTWWMNQEKLVAGRRVDLVTPLVLDPTSPAFKTWKKSSGYNTSGWTSYAQ
jgi:predicted amidohydrolase